MPNALTIALQRQKPAPSAAQLPEPEYAEYPADDEDYTPPVAWLQAQAERAQGGADDGSVKSNHINIPNPLSILKTTADKLSEAETNVLRPMMLEMVESLTDQADDLITRTNKDHAECKGDTAIWSDMSETEMATLVDSLLIVGKHEAHVAVAIREVAKAWRYVQVGIITFPRFIKTVRFYGEHGGFVLW